MNNMGKCKNCKLWDDSLYHGVGICNGIGINDPGFGWNQDPKILFDIEVTVSDDTNLQYDLKTGPEFGCVRFLNKNPED